MKITLDNAKDILTQMVEGSDATFWARATRIERDEEMNVVHLEIEDQYNPGVIFVIEPKNIVEFFANPAKATLINNMITKWRVMDVDEDGTVIPDGAGADMVLQEIALNGIVYG